MNACLNWLGADFFVRQGYEITTTDDGIRTAARDGQSFEIGRACDHEDCPPIPTKTLERA